MGNTGSGASSGPSKEVILCLHAVHNVQHRPNESYYGMVSDNPGDSIGVAVTSERPAKLIAGFDTVLTVRIFLHERGAASAADRLVGHLAVPIREMLALCGQGIYQSWFLLDTAGPGEMEPQRQNERFRHAYRTAVSQLQQPRICLTLVEASVDIATWLIDEANREAYYGTLLASHRQNWQMTRTYFELIESLADGCGFKQPPLVPVVEEPDARVAAPNPPAGLQPDHLRAQLEKLQLQQQTEEVGTLQTELDQVMEEANRRIEKGNENILKLKAQVKHQRDTEFPELQQHRIEAQGRLAVLRRQHDDIKGQIDFGGSAGAGPQSGAGGDRDLDEEIDQLNKQVLVLSEQKDMLMKMVKNVYDSKDSEAGTDQEHVSQLLTKSPDTHPGFSKMLPDPCNMLDESGLT